MAACPCSVGLFWFLLRKRFGVVSVRVEGFPSRGYCGGRASWAEGSVWESRCRGRPGSVRAPHGAHPSSRGATRCRSGPESPPELPAGPQAAPRAPGSPIPSHGCGCPGSGPSPELGSGSGGGDCTAVTDPHTALSCGMEGARPDPVMQIDLVMIRQRDLSQNCSLHSTGTTATANRAIAEI